MKWSQKLFFDEKMSVLSVGDIVTIEPFLESERKANVAPEYKFRIENNKFIFQRVNMFSLQENKAIILSCLHSENIRTINTAYGKTINEIYLKILIDSKIRCISNRDLYIVKKAITEK